MSAKEFAGKSDAGLVRSKHRAGDPHLLGRKSVLMGMLTSGFVIANAAQSSAMAAGTVKPSAIAATTPTYVTKWTSATAYVRGQQVISPNSDVVSANVSHTSSADFATDTVRWSLSSTYGPSVARYVFPSGGDDTAALQAALTGVGVDEQVIMYGKFITTGTVNVTSHLDATAATVNYTGTGIAMNVGTAAAQLVRRRIILPSVVNMLKTGTGWAAVVGSTGLKIMNAMTCDIYVPYVRGFETGLHVNATAGWGTCYCNFNMGQLDNNKVNLLLKSEGTGWVTQNQFMGGRFSHNSIEGVGVVGARHIQMTGASYLPGNNTFTGTSLEGLWQEYTVNVDHGEDNLFINCRFEGPARVRWGAQAYRNWIMGQSGTFLSPIVQTHVRGSADNVISSSRDVTGGPLTIVDPVAGGVTIDATVMRAGGVQVHVSAPVTSVTVQNGVDGQQLMVSIQQDAGTMAFVWPTNFRFAGTAPVCVGAYRTTNVVMRYYGPANRWFEISRAENIAY